jgi:hypothetical protein
LPQNPDWDFVRATHGNPIMAVPLAIGAKIAGTLEQNMPAPARTLLTGKDLSQYADTAQAEQFPFEPVASLPKATEAEIKALPEWLQKPATVGNEINKTVEGFLTPEQLAQLPGLELKPVQALYLSHIAVNAPELLRNIDQAKTPEERLAAQTQLGIQLGMAALLAKGVRGEELAKRFKPYEPKGKSAQPSVPMDEGAAVPAQDEFGGVAVNQPTEGAENAIATRSVEESVQPERERGNEGGQAAETGGGDRLQRAAESETPAEPLPVASPGPENGIPAINPAVIGERVQAGVPIQTFERPPDILDDIEVHAGGVRIPEEADFDYVREAFKDLSQSKAADLGGGKLKSLFRGTAPDEALDALHREGLYRNIETPDQLFNAMIAAAKSRVQWAKDEKAAAKFQPSTLDPRPSTEEPDWAVAEVGPNDFVGMGGATPGEFQLPKGTPTAIKNSVVDAERVKRGLPPAMQPARRAFGEVWDRADALLDQNPGAADELIAELRDKPRALTDTEDALLLQHQIGLQNDYAKLTQELAQAYDDAKEFPNRLDAVADLKDRVAKASDDLLDLYNINKAAGTETGRGLAARRMMAYEDYSLAKMELDKRAANGGRQLTEAERSQVQQLQEKIASTQKAYDDYVAKTEAERAQRQAQEEINDLVARVAKTPGYDRNVISLADRIVNALEGEAVKARARLKEKFQRVSSGVDPTILGDLAVVGAAKIARGALDFTRWSKEMIADFGEGVAPWLNQAWEKSNAKLDDAVTRVAKGKTAIAVKRAVRKEDVTGDREQIIEGIRKAKGQPLNELGPYVRKLAENFVRSGIKDRDALIDAVHGVLTKEVDPNLTRRQAMDAISGYGDFKPLNPDQVKAQLRELKGQMQQVAKLEDIQAKRPLQKTGIERRTPGDEERRLIQQVNEAKRRFGVVNTNPATQLKSALDAIKTRLRNQIKDLDFQISTKQKIVREKTPVAFDAEATRLKMERDALKAKYDEVFTKPGLTDAQRVQNALRTVKASIEEYDRRLAAKDISRTESKTPNTPELEAARARRDALRAEYQEMVDTLDPQRREQAALSALKTRLAQRTADYQERLAKGDFGLRPRRAIQPDAEAMRLKVEMEKAKQSFQRGLIEDRLKNRPWPVKLSDAFLRWRRGFLLSSPVTLAKLTAAAAQRLAIAPIEEAAGGVISKVLPGLAERAPREGGLNVNAEARALTEGFMRGLKDSWHQLRTGESELDVLHGRGREGAIGESDVLPKSIIDFFGHMHAALKAPVKRAEFERSFQKRAAWNMRQGVDVREPGVQTRIAIEAYKDANRSIFLQDNRVVSAYKAALARLEQPAKGTKQVPIGGKVAATALRTVLPIVRVPTNLVAETFANAFGLVSGSTRLAFALRKGIETLPPDQADLIMRHLKKGSLGAAVMALGFFAPNLVGGYYQPGQKRDKSDVPVGGLRIGGATVPTYLLHNPLLETLQLGATIRRVADSKLRKKDPTPQGIPAGLAAGALGLAEEAPFAREMLETSKAFDPHTRGAFFGELGKSIFVPQLAQWTAQRLDRDAQGEANQRKPETIGQHLETGIPLLRQRVPLAPLPANPAVSRFLQSIHGGTPEMREAMRQTLLRNLATNASPTSVRK